MEVSVPMVHETKNHLCRDDIQTTKGISLNVGYIPKFPKRTSQRVGLGWGVRGTLIQCCSQAHSPLL